MNERLRRAHYEMVVERLRSLMAEAEVDALIGFKGDNFTYVNTAASPFLSQSGFASIAMVVLPREGDVFGICPDFERPAVESEGMVPVWHDYPVWIYIDDQFMGVKRRKKNRRRRSSFLSARASVCWRIVCGRSGLTRAGSVWKGCRSRLRSGRRCGMPYRMRTLRMGARSSMRRVL